MPRAPLRYVAPLRAELLAERVRWLDRYRRMLAITAAVIAAPVLRGMLVVELGAEWPAFHATLLSLMFGGIVWLLAEVGLACVTAMWETEEYRLARDRGLPRAILLKPGR